MVSDIRAMLEANPFEPFTIVTTGGKEYPVPTVDHAGISPNDKRVVVWSDDGTGVTIAGLHISSIEKWAVGNPESSL